MSNPYDRNGHHAHDNVLAAFCTSCGRSASQWDTPCDHQSVPANEWDEHGCLIRRGVY